MAQTHRTIDRRKAAKDKESVAGRLAAAKQEKQATPAASAQATAQNTSRGSYYSPRQYGTNAGQYEAQVKAAQAAMEERTAALTEQRKALEQARSDEESKRKRYYDLSGMLEGEDGQQRIKALEDEWTASVQAYGTIKSAYDAAYQEYRPYELAYGKAMEDYNSYVTAEQTAYQDWRGTIRDAESIRAEQRELGKLRQELRVAMQKVNDYNADPTIMPPHEAAQYEARIQELQAYLGGKGDREKLLSEELEWSNHFLYEDLRSNADFAQKSGYQSTATGVGTVMDNLVGGVQRSGFGDSTYDFVNRNPDAAREILNDQAMHGSPYNDMSYLRQMTDDEVALYNYVYATQGAQAANGYLEHLRTQLTARQTQAATSAAGEAAAGSIGGAIAGSIGSVLLSPASGLISGAGQLMDWATGRGIDPNATYALGSNVKNAIREAVSAKIEEHTGPVGSFAYGTVMSMADMLADAAVGNPTAAMAMIGSRAFSEQVIDAKNRGLSDGEALALGVASGAAELITERLGVDELLKLPKGWEDAGFWKGLAKGALGEAGEEGLTNVMNLAADLAIAGDQSELIQNVERYKREGLSESEASLAALKDAGISLGADMLGGALSGGVFGGVQGLRGKKAAEAEKKAGAAEQRDGTEAVPYEEAPAAENATARENRTVEGAGAEDSSAVGKESLTTVSETEMVREQEATGAQNARVEEGAVGAENARTGEMKGPEAPVENGGTTDGTAGERVLHGEPERHDGESTGEPDGGYAEHRERQQTQARSQAEAAAQRRVKAENLEKLGRLQRVSARELGLKRGTEVQELLELPRYEWDQELYDTVSRLEQETGYKVRTVTGNIGIRNRDGSAGLARGYIDRVNETVVLNVSHSTITAGQIADHELYHWKCDAWNRISGDRSEVTRMAMKRIREEFDGEDLDAMIDAYVEGYGDVYDMDDAEEFLGRVYEEIIADAYAGINAFGTEASRYHGSVNGLLEENGLGRDLWNTSAQQDYAAPGGDQRIYTDEDAPPMPEYEEYSQVPPEDHDGPEWDHELDFSYGGISYSVDDNYSAEIDEWDKEGRPDGETFILGSTGDVLRGLGAIESDIYMRSEKIGAIMQKHPEMTIAEIKRIPEILDDPVLVLKSRNANRGKRANTRMVLFGSVKAANGLPVLTVLDLRPVEGHMVIEDMQKVNSSYTKTTDAIRFVRDSDVLYADKKRTTSLLRTIGFYMPIELQQSGYIGSISYRGQNVNIQGEPFTTIVKERSGERSDDAKVRFSVEDPDVRFSLEEPVEETKTLVAMHNLTAEKLEKALELGGFPMPSIAVTRTDIPHTNFGEITLVMDRKTVDPKADRRNDVYSADAWTPVFPRMEYEANRDVGHRVRETLDRYRENVAPQFRRDIGMVQYGLEELLNRYDGEEGLIERLLDNDGLKAAYLESRGLHIEEVQTEQEIQKRHSATEIEKYEAIIGILGTKDPAEIGSMPLKDVRDQYGAELEKAVPGMTKDRFRIARFLNRVVDYLMDDDSGPKTETVADYAATKQAVENALDREGFEAWVRELYSGIEADRGISNGKDPFTPSGRSRSFQQTHYQATLENIVKAMAAQNGGNTKNSVGFYGIKTIRAAGAKKFRNVEQMHQMEGRLKNLSESQLVELNEELSDRLDDVIREINEVGPSAAGSNYMMSYDAIGQMLCEAAEAGKTTAETIEEHFRGYRYDLNAVLSAKTAELLRDIGEMTVNLFEAKPRRVVRFDEVRAAVVPNDTSATLKEKLKRTGIRMIEYERDNTEDRVRKVNSVEAVRFSVEDELTREDYDRLMAEVAGDQSKRNEEFIRSKLTKEQYRQFKEFRKEDRMDEEAEARVRGIERFEEAVEQEDLAVLRAQQKEDAAAGRRELRREEKAERDRVQRVRDLAKKARKRVVETAREKARKEAAERIARAAENAKGDSAPTIARKELQDRLIGLFSVGEGQRGELRRIIGDLADRMIVEGGLDEGDLRNLINRLYDAGVMVIEPEEIYAEGRSYVKDEHIYISPELIREMGDDWQTLRKRAWGLGVYLSTDRQYAGLDVWNKDLASYLPGMFNAEETDQRTMLERILMIAEEGKAEKISLTEYTKRIAKAEHQSEQELLYNLERQVEEALRTFAEKASLETRLKDRANRRAAMDREKNAIAREQERIERAALREELADDREALRAQNEKARQALEDRRAEYERQNATERRRIAEERRARREKTQQAKRKKELRELQQKTLNALQWIAKNRRRAPEAMQAAFDEVLGDIDLYCISMADEMAWSSKHQATWKDLKAMYLHAREHDPNFLPSEDLDRIVSRLDKTQLEELDFDQLRDLYQAAVGLRTEYQQRNNVISDSEWEMMEEVYSGCVEEMKAAPKKLSGLIDRFLNLEQLTPMNVLAEMGGFNPNGMLYRFAKQLEDGERNVRGFTVKANRILADFLEENKDWVHKADGQGKDGIWYEVEIPELLAMKVGEVPRFGGTVKVWMTPMQKIHLYLESRNHDNLRHMTGGRTFADKELYSKGERQEAFAKGTTIRMAPETVQLIVKDLTPQELELANLLDRYYNDLAKTEINKVSNVLLGYDKAMGGKYAPIFTNQNYTKSEFGKFDGTAEGAGNLKERVKSKVPSYNISALDAFERNMDRTATYVGMAIPVRNWNTLMNWRTERSSFADEMTHAWGEGRRKYIEDLITDLQNPMGEQQDLVAEAASKLQSNYISSVFGFNPGIVVKQLGSIPMASAYLGWKHFPKGAIGKGKIDRELIGKYTPDLEWRTMGYSMPETKQLKDAPNWSQKNKAVGLIFGGDAITAMDGWAASVLWPWAENKVRADFPDLEVGDAAMIESGQSPFYKKVAEVFNDAVARSQSVSDQMHQGRLRKSKNLATKALTMFRSDTAQSYNVLRQLLGEMDYYKRMGKNHAELAEKTRAAVGAAVTAIAINSLWGTTVDLIVQALKGKLDDEEKEPMAILENFFWGVIESYAGLSAAGDLLAELVGGWFTGGMRYDTEAPGVEQFNDIMQAMDKVVNAGKKGNWLGAVKTAAETIASYGGGIPVKNVEAYLKGILSMVLPGVVVGYEDLLKAPAKADLKGLEGDGLMVRLNNVLKGYGMKLDRESREAIAKLYEQGYKEAVPSAAPDAVTIEGVELELDERMRKAYDKIRGGIIERELAQIVDSAFFTDADAKTQKSMLTKLYNYAAEKAKDSVLADYEISTSAQAIDEIIASGGSAADYAVFDAATADMKAWQKALVLREWGADEAVTGLMFKYLVSKSWDDEQTALREVGVDMGQFLELYAMHGEIDAQDLSASSKATNFAYWLDGQRYSDGQKATIKDQMTFFQFMPAEASRYNTATAAGLDREQALELTEHLDALEPPEGKDSVQQIQKYRVAIDDSVSESNQLKMLAAVGLKDSSYDKVKTGYDMGVAPAAWVRVKEVQLEYDANGNGSMTNAEWEAAVEGICAYGIVLPGDTQRFNMTNEQKAVLWQMLVSKSTKATNNPFSPEAGRRWRQAMGYE